jgi:hypothetical protein
MKIGDLCRNSHKYASPHFVTVENLGDHVYRPSAFPDFTGEEPIAGYGEAAGEYKEWSDH